MDEETIAVFERQWEQNLRELQRVLREGKYQVSLVLRVYIPKDSRGRRPLGIPTLRDRIAQQAIRLVIEPRLERKFSPVSFGFRPGRSPHDAHRAVVAYRKQGYRWVVDADIES